MTFDGRIVTVSSSRRPLLLVLLALGALLTGLAVPQPALADEVGCSPLGRFQYSGTYSQMWAYTGAECTHPTIFTVTITSKLYRGGTYIGTRTKTCARGTYSNKTCDIGAIKGAYSGTSTWKAVIAVKYTDGKQTRTKHGESSWYGTGRSSSSLPYPGSSPGGCIPIAHLYKDANNVVHAKHSTRCAQSYSPSVAIEGYLVEGRRRSWAPAKVYNGVRAGTYHGNESRLSIGGSRSYCATTNVEWNPGSSNYALIDKGTTCASF